MKRSNLRNLILDIFAFIAVVVMFGYIGVDIVMITLVVIVIPFLLATKRKYLIFSFLIALSLSIIWKLIAGNYYVYSFKKLILFGINLYPIFLWTFGLFAVALVYDDIKPLIKKLQIIVKLLIFSSLFWFGLLLSESVVYNFFGIKNLATASYSGIPYLNCIHAPHWMQISYFLMGPIYFVVMKLFKKIN